MSNHAPSALYRSLVSGECPNCDSHGIEDEVSAGSHTLCRCPICCVEWSLYHETQTAEESS